eukprot:GHVU01073451.1.p1 GENE.GHVU01073451.1~~GHVU01073451.1.p1  ORF type:complete len:170 (-),score=15.56 GHVU01073451.1:169-678(-)
MCMPSSFVFIIRFLFCSSRLRRQCYRLLYEEIAVEEAPTLLEPSDRVAASCRPDYIGSSQFGLTKELYNFWPRLGFCCVYLRQSVGDVTGEHSAIVLRLPGRLGELKQGGPPTGAGPSSGDGSWLTPFVAEFRCRLMSNLGGPCLHFHFSLALLLVEPPSCLPRDRFRR